MAKPGHFKIKTKKSLSGNLNACVSVDLAPFICLVAGLSELCCGHCPFSYGLRDDVDRRPLPRVRGVRVKVPVVAI